VNELYTCLGQASSTKAEQAGKLAENMADLAWTFASKEGFRLFNQKDSFLPQDPTDMTTQTKRHYSTATTSQGKISAIS